MAVARDIGDRIEAQANLRRLAESEHARAAELNAVIRAIGDGIFVCAADGRISLSNPAAEDVFPDVDERDVRRDPRPARGPRRARRRRSGTVGGPVELRARGAEERWIELSTYPVAREAGEPARIPAAAETIVMLRDVTAARQQPG